MTKQTLTFLASLTIAFTMSISGCSDSQPTSVTEDVEQSEIEAWKAKEAQIEADAASSMELE